MPGGAASRQGEALGSGFFYSSNAKRAQPGPGIHMCMCIRIREWKIRFKLILQS